MYNIRIEGLEALYAKLGRLSAHTYLRPPMLASLLRLQRRIRIYPAQQAKKTGYIREDILKGGWTTPAVLQVEVSVQGVRGTLGTNVEYAPYVQHPLLQARIHRGVWPTTTDVVEHEQANIVQEFRRAIDHELEA